MEMKLVTLGVIIILAGFAICVMRMGDKVFKKSDVKTERKWGRKRKIAKPVENSVKEKEALSKTAEIVDQKIKKPFGIAEIVDGPKIWIRLRRGEEATLYQVTDSPFYIGSGDQCHIKINLPYVEKRHIVIRQVFDDEGKRCFTLESLHKRNAVEYRIPDSENEYEYLRGKGDVVELVKHDRFYIGENLRIDTLNEKGVRSLFREMKSERKTSERDAEACKADVKGNDKSGNDDQPKDTRIYNEKKF